MVTSKHSKKYHHLAQPNSGSIPVVRHLLFWCPKSSFHNQKSQRPAGTGFSDSNDIGKLLVCSVLALFLLLSASCSKPDPGLTDREFSGIFVAVLRLHHQYAQEPDSLRSKRAALYRRSGVSEGDLDRFIARRSKNPQAWETTLRNLQASLDSDTSFVNRRKELEGYIKGRKYQNNQK